MTHNEFGNQGLMTCRTSSRSLSLIPAARGKPLMLRDALTVTDITVWARTAAVSSSAGGARLSRDVSEA